MAWHRYNAGQYALAMPLAHEAMKLYEERSRPQSRDMANALNLLGLVLQGMGDQVGARPYLERALAIHEKVLGADHPILPEASTTSCVAPDMGDLTGARPYLERALAVSEKALGADHPILLRPQQLGSLLLDMGTLIGARPYLERALAINEKVLGADHPDTARSINNLGALLLDMGDLIGRGRTSSGP